MKPRLLLFCTASLTVAASLALAGGAGPRLPAPPARTAPPVAPASPATVTRTFTNPVIPDDFPDPFILRVGKTYYAYGTNTGGVDLPVRKSNDLVNWQLVGEGFGRLGNWATGGFTWAPEVMAVKNGYTLYYTARHTDSGRQCIGVATSKSPEGPFRDESSKPLVCQLDQGGSIDASPLVDSDGKRYLYWKNDGNCCSLLTAIYVQQLSDDGLKLLGQPKDLIYNGALWEGNLIEAPNVYKRGSTYYLFYSAADYNSDTYSVGYATATSPTGPFRKQSRDLPWLFTKGALSGPGGQGVITDGAGQTWMYYHGWTTGQIGYEAGGVRSMRLDKLTFDASGKPVLNPTTTRTVAPAPLR
ncbi:glycoside hydrolase family 43 protein [Deinococcus yavapaiensis]|uniref:Glycosyl hydrolase family 43 n=1 Tax=Deinococcus yavapaiensis KR-236 TaxID=694435 RepID=A0A318SFF5_9DEIO|nr:glycoside hydrolase family 43 protein [Deinococcus yavapaiensis]PYE56527.1 glycosyl hydrolase family 43 [Deinococcus yavapaiensis KR-236]